MCFLSCVIFSSKLQRDIVMLDYNTCFNLREIKAQSKRFNAQLRIESVSTKNLIANRLRKHEKVDDESSPRKFEA